MRLEYKRNTIYGPPYDTIRLVADTQEEISQITEFYETLSKEGIEWRTVRELDGVLAQGGSNAGKLCSLEIGLSNPK